MQSGTVKVVRQNENISLVKLVAICNLSAMPYVAKCHPSLPVRPLPPTPPTAMALRPRPWLSRLPGECAFPVDGEGWTTRACCNPCGSRAYCEPHLALIRRAA